MLNEAKLSRSMSRRLQGLLGDVGAVLSMIPLIILLQASVTTAFSGIEPSTTVNRTHKGDRLPANTAFFHALDQHFETRHPSSPSIDKLADGCEALVSPLANLSLSRIPRRCVS
jgi:hypothetical protein